MNRDVFTMSADLGTVNNMPGVEKTRIITFVNLIRVFASMFLEEPHRTTRNYRALLEGVGKSIFSAGDRLDPYFVSALALYRLEFLFRNQILAPAYKAARYHVLFAARLLAAPDRPPRMNLYNMDKYCSAILPQLTDPAVAEQLFVEAARRVEIAAAGNFHRDHIELYSFTDELRKVCTPCPGEADHQLRRTHSSIPGRDCQGCRVLLRV